MGSKLKQWVYYVLIVIGVLGVLDTALILIYAGVNVGTLFPGVVGAIILMYVYIKLKLRKGRPVIQNSMARKLVHITVLLGVLSFVFVEVLIAYNSSAQEDVEADYMIILGGGLRGDKITLTLEERLLKGIEYLEKYPDTKVIVSGGLGLGDTITEAEAMKRYLVSRGIDAGRIIKEDKATSTMENFVYSKQILEKAGAEDITRIVVITNDFHMLRAKMLARRVGFDPYGITCRTPVSVIINNYSREYFALIKSFIFDK